MLGDATPDIVRAAIKDISASLKAVDGLEDLQPGDCEPENIRAVMARVHARLALLGDGAPLEVGDGRDPAVLNSAFDAASARIATAAGVYRPIGLGDYVGDLIWGDVQLGHAYTRIVAADLTSLSGTLNAGDTGDGDTTVMTALIVFDLPALTAIGGRVFIIGDPVLDSINLPSLTTVNDVANISNNAALTTVNISAMTSVKELDISSNPILVSLAMPALISAVGDFNLSSNALDQASVDAILIKLASLDGTGGTTSYDGRTIDLSSGTNSPPSGTGLAAVAVLESTDRGNTVITN